MATLQVTAILGAQWGDEGKGKLVDCLAGEFDVVARFNGGSNAGHTIIAEGHKYAFHLLPSGIVNKNTICVIGNGVVLHIPTLLHELESLDEAKVNYDGRLKISDRAHIVLDIHQTIDGLREQELSKGAIGTTKKGVGPAYASKANRIGLRICDLQKFDTIVPTKLRLLIENEKKRFPQLDVDVEKEIEKYRAFAKKLEPWIVDSVELINESYKAGKKILLEGANGALLDIDFGTYPYVTSSNTTVGGTITGLGLAPQKVKQVIAIVKAYTTRVGEGPFPTELLDTVGDDLRKRGHEFGTTTGRPRRCGWLDLVVVRYSHMLNGYTEINLTKLDILSGMKEIKIGVSYTIKGKKTNSFPASLETLRDVEVEYITLPGWDADISNVTKFSELPKEAQTYVETIEKFLEVPIRWIGVGPQREALISH